jgi:putative hemolysin
LSGTWAALPLLLAASCFFSASETALFALSDEERARAPATVQRLLAEPQALLVTVLLSNLLVNVLFFAAAARLSEQVPVDGPLVALFALAAVLLLGELLPKAAALATRERTARLCAVPLLVLVRVASLPRRALQGLLELARRALGEFGREEQGLSAATLARVLEASSTSGLIEAREAELLTEIVELETIRVRQILTPRVDMLVLDLDERDEELRWFTLARALARRLVWLPAVRGGADEIAGQLRLRDVLARPEVELEHLVQPVVFVPDSASLLDLLRVLRERQAAEAVVVDEHGGTAGIVTIEQVFEELVGDLRVEGEREAPLFEALGDGVFLVSGQLAIRDWNELFGHRVVPEGFETVGGLVTALLGRVPRLGDRVQSGGLEVRVRALRGRRVETVEIRVAGEVAA